MSRSLHPPCAGSDFYGPHSAKVPTGYTVTSPGGTVWYACDTDCLRRKLGAIGEAAREAGRGWPALRKLAGSRGAR
jgi:hypothetical protein